MSHGNKNVNGLNKKAGGTINLYEGFNWVRGRQYSKLKDRNEIIDSWTADVARMKRIDPTNQYYFVIIPNTTT